MLGALGKREMEQGGTCELPSADRAMVGRQATKVMVQSTVVAVVAPLIAWMI
jgi:hypothetical protein